MVLVALVLIMVVVYCVHYVIVEAAKILDLTTMALFAPCTAADAYRKLLSLPRVEDQEEYHQLTTHHVPPLASVAAASKDDENDISATSIVNNHVFIVLRSSNLSPVAASVAAQFDGNIMKQISLVLSLSVEKEAHVRACVYMCVPVFLHTNHSSL